jgi:plasmid stability protein
METTLDLPAELVEEIRLRAAREGKPVEDEVAELLRRGLAASSRLETVVDADESQLIRRREIAAKFISGEWGLELDGYEAGRAADREAARKQAELWGK